LRLRKIGTGRVLSIGGGGFRPPCILTANGQGKGEKDIASRSAPAPGAGLSTKVKEEEAIPLEKKRRLKGRVTERTWETGAVADVVEKSQIKKRLMRRKKIIVQKKIILH